MSYQSSESHSAPEVKILVASHDPTQAEIRKRVLGAEGFRVIPAMGYDSVNAALHSDAYNLVMIGHSVPPADRRRIVNAVRRHSEAPILQLVPGGRHEVYCPDEQYFDDSPTPDDFLGAVKFALSKKC